MTALIDLDYCWLLSYSILLKATTYAVRTAKESGGVIGYFAGFGFAQVIGQSVFGSAIEMKPMVIPLVAVLVVAVTLLGSIPAVRTLLRLDPTVVLHGR